MSWSIMKLVIVSLCLFVCKKKKENEGKTLNNSSADTLLRQTQCFLVASYNCKRNKKEN